MNEKVRALAQEANALTPEERADLVGQIFDGLADEPPRNRVEQAWLELAEARMEGVRRGEIETVDADEFMQVARASLACARARRMRKK